MMRARERIGLWAVAVVVLSVVRLSQARLLRVGICDPGYAPFVMKNEAGEYTGFDIDQVPFPSPCEAPAGMHTDFPCGATSGKNCTGHIPAIVRRPNYAMCGTDMAYRIVRRLLIEVVADGNQEALELVCYLPTRLLCSARC